MNNALIGDGWLSATMTIVLLVCFLVIVAWAWNSRRKEEFDQAARMPLSEDETVDTETPKTTSKVQP